MIWVMTGLPPSHSALHPSSDLNTCSNTEQLELINKPVPVPSPDIFSASHSVSLPVLGGLPSPLSPLSSLPAVPSPVQSSRLSLLARIHWEKVKDLISLIPTFLISSLISHRPTSFCLKDLQASNTNLLDCSILFSVFSQCFHHQTVTVISPRSSFTSLLGSARPNIPLVTRNQNLGKQLLSSTSTTSRLLQPVRCSWVKTSENWGVKSVSEALKWICQITK